MDPNAWTARIVDCLFERDQRRLDHQLHQLIEANMDLGNSPAGFLFGGVFHSELPIRERASAEKKLLHQDLHEAGRTYLADIKQTDQEKTRLTNGVSLLLQSCHSIQDVRDALPDTVVTLFPELAIMDRLREEGWPFRNKPMQLHNYQITSDLLAFYVANRLLY